jgi:TatD DNase family protein
MIDSHTHLCDSVFDDDKDEVLQRAEKAGVVSILLVSETKEDAEKNLALARKHSMLFPLAGLYPAILDFEKAEAMLNFIREHRDDLVGIGEVGLDFWIVKEESQRVVQKEILTRFVRLSNELGMPLNVHSRSAGRHVIDLLLEQNAERVHLHAFDGKASTALPAVEAGYFFSIPPSVVRSRQKQKLVKHLPLSCLMLETDSPVLGPVPGQRNEPMNVVEVVGAVAELKGVGRKDVAEAAFQNTLQLYGEHVGLDASGEKNP